MFDLDSFSIQQLKYKENQNLRRVIKSYETDGVFKIDSKGVRLVDFASNDYFGMSHNKEVLSKVKEGYSCFGSGSSRLISGSSKCYDGLESELSNYHKMDRTLVFGSGYLVALGFYKSFFDKHDLIITDKNIHACHIDGIKLSAATLKRFRHNDVVHLEKILKTYRHKFQKCIIVSETLFSMHGDFAPIKNLSSLSELYNCHILFDDAHGFMLDHELSEIPRSNLIIMGTCSKALGSYGGYLSASQNICDFLQSDARSLIYSTALPQLVLKGTLAVMHELVLNSGFHKGKLQSNIEFFEKSFGLINARSPIKIIEFDTIDELEIKCKILHQAGLLVAKIRPPTAETPRIRISISSEHSQEMISSLAKLLK
jgi:8-amino-7-oxononanoate synthase